MKTLLERISLILGNINEKKGLLDFFAKESGKSIKEIEKLWHKSKKIVNAQYPNIEVESEKFFQLTVWVLKSAFKI